MSKYGYVGITYSANTNQENIGVGFYDPTGPYHLLLYLRSALGIYRSFKLKNIHERFEKDKFSCADDDVDFRRQMVHSAISEA